MASQLSGGTAVAIHVYQALFGRAPSNALLNTYTAQATANASAFAADIASSFANTTNAALALQVLTNVNITATTVNATSYATLLSALEQAFAGFGVAARGQIILNLTNILSNIEGDATFGTAAVAFNNQAAANFVYGANPANTVPSTGPLGGNEAAKSLVLTVAQDVLTGSTNADFFRGVAGAAIGAQDQSTLNSSDILDGGDGIDTAVILLNGNYGGGARLKSIETLQIGTNTVQAGGVTFDYNVNAGVNEVSDVTTIVADQINGLEILSINNVVRALVAGVASTPKLNFVNDSSATVAATAGTVNLNYRAAELTGTTDAQGLGLKSVLNGVFNVSGGIETINLEGQGTEQVTLNNSTNADAGGGNVVAADLISQSTLTKVVITHAAGSTAVIGKVAGLNATVTPAGAASVIGLTDRAANGANDFGVTVLGAAGNGTGSNLLSVGSRVIEVDASAAVAATNVRFTAKTTAAETNVIYKGGLANDYVEFEVGNINATGGTGDDTFAFINAGLNSTFTTADSISGGAGSDTIQLGLNGAGTFVVDFTEFNNKTGIDVLDLRGAVNTVTLADGFVTASDAGLMVRTDRIVQTSLTDAANAIGSSTLEDLTVNTINLTKLVGNRAITVQGGSGSDRIVANEQSLTSNATLVGGTNVGAPVIGGASVAATLGDYDTITVIDNAVLSRGDLSKVSGFEGLILVKSDNLSNRQFTIELTEAFILANTLATDDTTVTGIDDRAFQIGTAAAANSNALSGADTVTIDISDLFTAGVYKASLGTRGIDVTTLTNAGVTVNFINNGVAVAVGAAARIDNNGVGNTGQTTVIGSAAIPVANIGSTMVAQGAGFNTTSGFLLNGVVATNFADTLNSTDAFLVGSTINLAGSADTLNVTTALTAVGVVNAAAGTETLNLQAGTTGNQAINNAGITTITLGAAGNVTVNTATIVTGSTAADIINGSGANDTLNNGGGAGADVLTGNGGVDTFNITGTGAATVIGGAAVDTLVATTGTGGVSFTGAGGQDVATFNAANAAIDRVVFAIAGGGVGVVANVDADTITGFVAANDIIVLDIDQTTAATLTATTPIVQVVAAAGAFTAANTADITVLNFDMAGATSVLAGVINGAALLTNTGAVTVANAQVGYLLAYDNGNAFLYSYTEASGNAALEAGEIALIGTFNGVATSALAVANFALV